MRFVQNISFHIVLASIISIISYVLKSDFLFTYLQENIIGLLLTLLAINTATLGLIASKIQDMLDKYPKINFSNTIREMKYSLSEQIVLIIISVISLTLLKSEILIFNFKDLVFNTLLVGVLTYSVSILWDTGKGVFVIIELIQNLKNKE